MYFIFRISHRLRLMLLFPCRKDAVESSGNQGMGRLEIVL
jgi:hypothetical protein